MTNAFVKRCITSGRARAKRGLLRALSVADIHVSRASRQPGRTMLGLTHRPIRTVLDIGANTGQFARLSVSAFPEATVYSFEPQPVPYAKLQAWAVTTNGRVQTFNLALGETTGEVAMIQHLDHDASSSLLAATEETRQRWPATRREGEISVRLDTLDNVISQLSTPLSDEILLKMDVQGYEDRVLAGASEVLKHVTACLTEVNLDPLYRNQAKFEILVDILARSGLKYAGNLDQMVAPEGHAVYCDALFVRR